jgi:hypothetical protein
MTIKEFKNLRRGDIVKHELYPITYVVDSNYGDRVTAMTTADMTNPSEWKLIFKANYKIGVLYDKR